MLARATPPEGKDNRPYLCIPEAMVSDFHSRYLYSLLPHLNKRYHDREMREIVYFNLKKETRLN